MHPATKKKLLTVLTVAACGAAVMAVKGFRTESQPIESAADSTLRPHDVSEADPRLAALDAKLSALTKELTKMQRALAERPSSPNEPRPAKGHDVQPRKEQQAPREDVIVAQETALEDTLRAERRDPEWAQQTEQAWSEIFTKEEFREQIKGIQVTNAVCRATLCRVEFAPTDVGAGAQDFEQNVRKLVLFSPMEGPSFGRIEQPEGQSPVAVLFQARGGYPLPRPGD